MLTEFATAFRMAEIRRPLVELDRRESARRSRVRNRERFAAAFSRALRQRYAERWITLNSDNAEGGGTPVKLDDSGKIAAGPDALTGKHIGQVAQGKKGTENDRRGHNFNPQTKRFEKIPKNESKSETSIDSQRSIDKMKDSGADKGPAPTKTPASGDTPAGKPNSSKESSAVSNVPTNEFRDTDGYSVVLDGTKMVLSNAAGQKKEHEISFATQIVDLSVADTWKLSACCVGEKFGGGQR